LDHDLGGLHHNLNRIAHLQIHFVGAGSRNHALDNVVAHTDEHMSHDVAEFQSLDTASQFIARG